MVKPEISLIIPTRNNQTLLSQCLRSVFNQNFDSQRYEVIVVDDGSSDGTVRFLERLSRRLSRLIVMRSRNRGASAARNTGLSIATGKIICFVDSDMILEKDWIRKICETYRTNRTLSGISGTSINAYPRNIFARVSQDLTNNSLETSLTLPTNNCSYRKKVLDKVGGFSEDVIIGNEDAELSCRVNRAGYKVLRNEPIFAYHHQVSSLKRFLGQAFVYGHTDYWYKMKHGNHLNIKGTLGYLHHSIKRISPVLCFPGAGKYSVSSPTDFLLRLIYILTYGFGAFTKVAGYKTIERDRTLTTYRPNIYRIRLPEQTTATRK